MTQSPASTARDDSAFLQIHNVVKDFGGYKAVNNVSLDIDRKSTRLNSSHIPLSRMPSSA